MRRLILITLVLTSCKPTEKSITGTYTRYWDFENHTTLTLKGDKTFSFKAQEGLVFFDLYGTWTIDKDKLVLNSPDDRYLAGFFEQVKSRDFLTLTIQNSHEEDQIHRSPDHWDLERTGIRPESIGHLPQARHQRCDVLQLEKQVRWDER